MDVLRRQASNKIASLPDTDFRFSIVVMFVDSALVTDNDGLLFALDRVIHLPTEVSRESKLNGWFNARLALTGDKS